MRNDNKNDIYMDTDIVLLLLLPFLIQKFGILSTYKNVIHYVFLRQEVLHLMVQEILDSVFLILPPSSIQSVEMDQ